MLAVCGNSVTEGPRLAYSLLNYCPKGFCAGEPQNSDVRLSVRVSVCASVPLRFDHFLDPVMCDIALNITFDRKKDGKKEVSPQILRVISFRWKQKCAKNEHPGETRI